MVKAPCKDCENREVGCHGKCILYKQFKSDSENEKQVIRNEKIRLFGNMKFLKGSDCYM